MRNPSIGKMEKANGPRPIDSRILAAIRVPATPIIDRAMEYARRKCEPYLFNHVVRSWLFAVRLGQLQRIEYDAEVLAVGPCCTTSRLTETSLARAVSKSKPQAWHGALQQISGSISVGPN